VIGPDGEQIGILPTKEALERAHQHDLDLVEVSPNSRPPVCRILDYGKFKYELSKKDRLAKKKQHSFQLKEMRFRPKIDEHDFALKVFVMFRGREMAYTENGRKVLNRVAEVLNDVGIIENQPRLEGRHMNMIMAPTAEVMKQLKNPKPEKPEKAANPDEAEMAVDKAAETAVETIPEPAVEVTVETTESPDGGDQSSTDA